MPVHCRLIMDNMDRQTDRQAGPAVSYRENDRWHKPTASFALIGVQRHNKKHSLCWQTARRLFTPMLRSSHKTLQSSAFHVVLSRAALWWMTAIYWPDFPTFTYPSRIWCLEWVGSSRAIGFIFGVGKGNGWATIWWRSHDDRLSHLGTIPQGDRHTHRQPRRHSKCRAKALRRAAKIAALMTYLNLNCSTKLYHST